MKLRKARKAFWWMGNGHTMRAHCRKVKPLPGMRWAGCTMVPRT